MSGEEGKPTYSPQPRRRRGNRRATSGSNFTGQEPRLAGLAEPADVVEQFQRLERDRWLKEQRPPHHDIKSS